MYPENHKSFRDTFLIIHEVADYAKWKDGFDQAGEQRKMAGEIDYQLLHFEDGRNKIVHYSQWLSTEKAKEFFESKEIKELRKKLGVKQPEFIYLQGLENYCPTSLFRCLPQLIKVYI